MPQVIRIADELLILREDGAISENRVPLLTVLLVVFVSIMLLHVALAQRQYHLEHEWVQIWINQDGSIDLSYDVGITLDSGSDINYVTIAQPKGNFTIVYAIDEYGHLLTAVDASSGSDYKVRVNLYSPLTLEHTIRFNLTTNVAHMIYEDGQNPRNVGMQFVPTWWSEASVLDLRVSIALPPEVNSSIVKTSVEWNNTSIEDGRLIVYWERQNVEPNQRYDFGISFPGKYLQACKACAFIDELSQVQPNVNLIQMCTSMLENEGFSLSYYESNEITVSLCRSLPLYDYDLIIFRVNSAVDPQTGTLVLFTGEEWDDTKASTIYLNDMLNDRLAKVRFAMNSTAYFGMNSNFVKTLNGDFQNATVMMMGSNGLTNTRMAEAFVEKGARAFIGWDDYVSLQHSDTATLQFLEHFITEKKTIDASVKETILEIGPDPFTAAKLLYCPSEAAGFQIPEFQPLIISSVVVVATLLAAIFYRKNISQPQQTC
jgi:hypothetical protein